MYLTKLNETDITNIEYIYFNKNSKKERYYEVENNNTLHINCEVFSTNNMTTHTHYTDWHLFNNILVYSERGIAYAYYGASDKSCVEVKKDTTIDVIVIKPSIFCKKIYLCDEEHPNEMKILYENVVE